MAATNRVAAPTALIVDDQKALAELLAVRLGMEGVEATVATRATEGLALSARQTFDVAFVDLKLPDMSGIAAATEMKKNDPNLRVILITGYAASVDESEPGWTHIDGVLPKPWRPAELEAILNTLRREER